MSIEEKSIDTIRCLAMDAVEKANSGHPGTPMALAPAAYVLWMKHLRLISEPVHLIKKSICIMELQRRTL